MIRFFKSVSLIVLASLPFSLMAQTALNDYIQYGIENNLTLKQKVTSCEKSLYALKEAKGLFYPNVSLNARYSVAQGGRSIDFPIGDLLNPVYNTLNALTASNNFSLVENQQVMFLRPYEHETKIRIVQPIFNPDIKYNSLIKGELVSFEEIDVEQYKRELVAEIKKSYYNVLMSESLISMLKNTRKLLEENVRLNRKLVENDKLTIDNLYRSETELSKFEQEMQKAEKAGITSKAYFNFLLNRAFPDSIVIEQITTFPAISDISSDYSQMALSNREELKKLEAFEKITDLQIKMNQSNVYPDLLFVADVGYQGMTYKFNKDYDYAQASAVLSWSIFEGYRNKYKIKQSLLQKEMVESQLEASKKQIELQVINALQELLSSEKGIIAAEARLKSAREVFRLVNRKYEEGQAYLIEFIDARTSLTQAEENLIISKYKYLSDFAEFEKITTTNIPL